MLFIITISYRTFISLYSSQFQAKVIDEVFTLMTPQIVTGDDNIVVHNEWDNLNKITTSTHGRNIVNSAGGIIKQEHKQGSSIDSKRALPIFDRSKTRSHKVDTPETLPPVHVHNRVDPKFPAGSSFIPQLTSMTSIKPRSSLTTSGCCVAVLVADFPTRPSLFPLPHLLLV